MNNKNKVRQALTWKQSDILTAARLGISVEEYRKLKEEIRNERTTNQQPKEAPTKVSFDEDLSKDAATLEYHGPKEVKTKEDLVKECNIDLDKWDITRMVHNAWGKDGNQNYQVKAWLTAKKEEPVDLLAQVLKDYEFTYTPSSPVHINQIYTDKTCAVLSLQDIHIGKEVIEGINDVKDSVKKCIENLIMRSYHSCNLDKIIFVLGGDLLNVDTYNGTTTSGTQVESSMNALEMYKEAFDLMFWAINYMKQFCNTLEVVYIPGNHDRLSSGQLAYSLSKVIQDDNIIWNVDYAERKVIVYGNSMIVVEHGDVTINKSFFAVATEFAKEWGETKFRTLYSGHYHKEKKVEYITADEVNGFTLKILPSLSKTDRYHSTNKWVNNKRGGVIELHSEINGPTGTFSYYE